MSARDTTQDALSVRTALYRSMSSDRRSMLAAEMAAMTRTIALDGIKSRHPEYDRHQAQMALFRMLVGDEMFRRAWPDEPLLPL